MGDSGEASKSLQCSYEVAIQNYSMIKDIIEIYKSAVFEAHGYKWQLVVHPNGNKRKNVEGHISVYLAMAERVKLGWELNAVFHLYLKNHERNPGSQTQERWFNPLKLEHGFDEFMDLATFEKHLKEKNDSCTFGAKVTSVRAQKKYGRAECLSMLDRNAPTVNRTWKIDKFSTKLNVQEPLSSPIFGDGTVEWKIQLYPKENDCLPVHLGLANSNSLSSARRIYAKVKLSIRDQAKCSRQTTFEENLWFSKSEKFEKRFPVTEMLFKESKIVVVEANVKVLGSADSIEA